MAGEKYTPTEEDIFAAENSLTPEQKEASLIREEGYQLGARQAHKESRKAEGASSERTEKTVVKIDPELLKGSISIIELGPIFTVKFQNMCSKKNILTIEQLTVHSAMSLRGDGFGDKSLRALNQWLGKRGLSLRKGVFDMSDEELLNSPEAIKQDFRRLDFNLEDLFIKISDVKDRFLESEPIYGEQIINLLDRAGKKTVFDLLDEEHGLEDLFNRDYELMSHLVDFFKKNYNISIGYCNPGVLHTVTRWYNAKLEYSNPHS